MKTKYIELKDESLFYNYLIKDGYLDEINDEENILSITKKEGNIVEIKYEEIYALYPIAIYMLGNILRDAISSEKDNKIKIEIENALLDNKYFALLISLELDRYFLSNDKLVEKLFLKFNLKGLKNEIKLIKEDVLVIKESDELKEKLYNSYKENGVNVLDYKELKVEYIDGELNLINLKGDLINAEEANNLLGIQFDIVEEDKWITDIYLCTMICIILKATKLTIPKQYKELFDELVYSQSLIETGIEIILE